MTDDIDDPFLTIAEAARVLRVSRRTLDNYRSRKQGPAPWRPHRLPAQRSPRLVRAAPRPPLEGGQAR
jgi:hypothetical protein